MDFRAVLGVPVLGRLVIYRGWLAPPIPYRVGTGASPR